MRKVLFVDDEILAMEYLRNLIPWEEKGFQVVGHARSSRKALEIFAREQPEIVISDIRMTGMDGLELAAKLKEINPETIIVLLSAYKDFEYAQKGIEYGVFNYLLKHELCEEKLLEELDKIEERLEQNTKKRKIQYQYFVRCLISNEVDCAELSELGNRFFLVLVHKNDLFRCGRFIENPWTEEETGVLEPFLQETDGGIRYITEVKLTGNNLLVLYGIEDITSIYQISSRIEQLCRRIGAGLSKGGAKSFQLIYSGEISRESISHTFQRLSGQIRYAVFWKEKGIYALNRLPEHTKEEKISWNERIHDLRMQICREHQQPDEEIEYLFELVKYPVYNLQGLRELIYMLENLLRELQSCEGISIEAEKTAGTGIEEIQQYYVECFHNAYEEMLCRADCGYSRIVQEMLRYIRQNFSRELSLDILGEEFQMNGVYLGQIFKKETGITFLRYLTNCRMEEAKRLLKKGELNISQVSEQVGYRTSQYFSQIFIKSVGMKPQEYRKWNSEN